MPSAVSFLWCCSYRCFKTDLLRLWEFPITLQTKLTLSSECRFQNGEVSDHLFWLLSITMLTQMTGRGTGLCHIMLICNNVLS